MARSSVAPYVYRARLVHAFESRPFPFWTKFPAISAESVSRLGFLMLAISIAWLPSAAAQEWTVSKTIAVGAAPDRAALTPDGHRLYVSNRGSGTVSVIDTGAGEVKTTIKVGNASGSLAASHDGRRVYVLVQREVQGSGSESGSALGIINTADDSITYLELPGQRWDELAITRDDQRLYLTDVVGPGNGYPRGAVDVLNLKDMQLEKIIQEDAGCPVGIALSRDERRIFVNYQCFGPGGDVAHDVIGVYEVPSYRRSRVITGLANVGGELAISPDGTQLWAQGNDACSRPDYPHYGCPSLPSRVVNVVDTSNLKPVKAYGFPLEDGNGRISFSPDGDAFVGDGIYLKQIATNDLETVRRTPIASAGEVAFQRDERRTSP